MRSPIKFKVKYRQRLLLTLSCFAFYIGSFAQCPKSVLYYKGKFYKIYYKNITQKDSVGKTAFLSFDRITKKNIDSLSGNDKYIFERFKDDSIGICSNFVERYSNGSKWAIFNKRSIDFKYDYAYAYLPKKQDGKYYHYEDPYAMAVAGKNWGLIDHSGKELTSLIYKLPETIGTWNQGFIYTSSVSGKRMDSIYNNEAYSQRVIDYPLACDLIVFSKDNKVGAVDSLGKIIIPFKYDTLFLSHSSSLQGAREGKRFTLTNSGHEINGYDSVKPLILVVKESTASVEKFSGIFLVCKKGKWGCINSIKNEMTDCIFINDSDFLTFKSYADTFTHPFSTNKKYFNFEIKYGRIRILDDDGKDVTSKFMLKQTNLKK